MPPRSASEPFAGPVGLVTLRSPTSAAAEAYRALRLSLQYSGVDAPLRIVLVTSPSPGDGRTTVVANLGVVCAEAGARVLLVDCDLREPALHRCFGLDQKPGLTNALIVEGEFPIQQTLVPGLSLLAAGDLPPNPGELIASKKLGETLRALRDRFDLLLLDSPPAALVSDAAVLGAQVDGTLLVVAAGKTKRDQASRARAQLDQVGARVLGTVLNNARLDRSQSDYHKT